MTIIDLAYIKTHLGVESDQEDDRLTQWIEAVDSMIARELGHPIASSSVTEYASGNGTPYLFLTTRRITAITNIWVDSAGWFGDGDSTPFGSDTLLVSGTDYALVKEESEQFSAGVIRRIGGVWPQETGKRVGDLVTSRVAFRGNIKATVVAGYATVPADLQYMAAVMVSICRRTGKAGGPISGFSFEGFSKAFGASAPDDLTSVESIMKRYRKWTLI